MSIREIQVQAERTIQLEIERVATEIISALTAESADIRARILQIVGREFHLACGHKLEGGYCPRCPER